MGKGVQKALKAISGALSEQDREIKRHDARITRLEKVVEAQATELAIAQNALIQQRDESIRNAVRQGVPSKNVAKAYGLSPARIAQIAPRKQ